MNDEPKYPEIEVRLFGEDGNAFFIIGRTLSALRRGGVPKDELDAFAEEASSGDYDHAIRTVMRTVTTY